jgi:hypothetical protein
MQTLNIEQIDGVSGGIWEIVIPAIIVVTLSVIAAGHMIGKEMAERDNRLTCKQ